MSDLMDQSVILNKALVEQALDLATPSILEMFNVEKPMAIWGPRYLVVKVRHPSLKEPVVRKIGKTTPWNDEWGNPEDFEKIAGWKAETAQIHGIPTSQLTLQCPWDHRKGDYLYPGGVVDGNLAVGASGVKGFADEGSAYSVLYWIEALSKLKREQLREDGVGQLI